jgi:hypothetical protein
MCKILTRCSGNVPHIVCFTAVIVGALYYYAFTSFLGGLVHCCHLINACVAITAEAE